MARSHIRLRINHSQSRAYAGLASRAAVEKAAVLAEQRYRNNILAADLVDTRELIDSVQRQHVPGSTLLTPAIAIGAAAKHAVFHEFGTRAHGPVKAKMLRFKPKGSSTFVFAKWVRGVRPTKFAQRALDMTRPTDFE